MNQQSESTFTFGARSLRTNRNKPIEIFVSAGSFAKPYYTFTNKKGRIIEQLKINAGKQYRFRRADNASTHPFYISDQGFNQQSTRRVKIRGDGQFNSGIINTDTLTFSIKRKYRREFIKSGQLFFYCTSHASMTDEFLIHSGRRKPQLRSHEKQSTSSGGSKSFEPASPTLNLEPTPMASKAFLLQKAEIFDNAIITLPLPGNL